ncbi:DUF1080 domain-containing protein [bacterium]|nr:DUF1080 domain-containing protein [bacterium]
MKSRKGALVSLMCLAVMIAAPVASAAELGWVDLFDGKTLDGWTIRSGRAAYRIEGDAIVGKTTEGSPNSFLCTNKDYGDFELEFEVKVDDALNSGVQIRSLVKGDRNDPKGRVYGPQAEIEKSPGQSGWIYGEAMGGGWMSEEPKKKGSNKLMKNGAWNKYRIVAKGPRIQTWINGEPVADLTHEKAFKSHPKGMIGLQVHSIGKGKGPFEVSWRKLRIKELNLDK